MESIRWKTRGKKSRATVPLRNQHERLVLVVSVTFCHLNMNIQNVPGLYVSPRFGAVVHSLVTLRPPSSLECDILPRASFFFWIQFTPRGPWRSTVMAMVWTAPSDQKPVLAPQEGGTHVDVVYVSLLYMYEYLSTTAGRLNRPTTHAPLLPAEPGLHQKVVRSIWRQHQTDTLLLVTLEVDLILKRGQSEGWNVSKLPKKGRYIHQD